MTTAPKPGTIHLHIDKLVLRGFARLDEAALTAALHEALVRELGAAPGLPAAHLANVRASMTLPARYDARAVGNALGVSLGRLAGSGDTSPHRPRHD